MEPSVIQSGKTANIQASFQTSVTEIQALYGKIKKWNFDILKKYVIQKSIYTADEVDSICDEYCKFIAMSILVDGKDLPISAKIDTFWHTHILFTEDYRNFCKIFSGSFIDHRPAILDCETNLKSCFVINTLDIYSRVFGDIDKSIWDTECCMSGNCVAHIKSISLM